MAETKSNKKFLPEVVKERTYEFELVGEYKPVNYGVGSECVVYDPIEKKEISLRYAPGWNSIIVEDQPDIEERLRPKIDINFSRGVLRIPGSKTQYVQFMLLHDKLEGNPNSVTKNAQFRLVDKTEKLREIRESLEARSKAVAKALDSPFEEIIPMAGVLGVSVKKIPGEETQEYEDRVRTAFMEKAEADPVNFLSDFEDPKHKREYDIILAFDQNILTDSYRDNEVNWEKSKELVVKLPASAVTRKFLANYTFTEEGAKFYETLKKLIKY